ncbi:multidrug efflux MFS transporter [Actinomadura barringtoniae]|uniref:Multidrug efflux MFS transporter n=1 Tax=Actinomadura barringtoniae TaxID=1427535 RepID=A0A939PEH4_9ACTN|nr:MDR family MFS transporter [Actinomadura barringtoniae]MBO2447031.1 multidrug efflux MFS transporter [Actinomadura barringtoniae]
MDDERLDPAVIRLAGVLLPGVMAVILDTTIVTVAIDTLGHDLHAPVSTTQWIITAYLLALGMVVPISGWAVGRFGGKRMWLVALGLFLLGSVLCSLAPSAGALIAFRVFQGAGGGLMLPIMQTLLVEATGGRALGRTMSLIGLPVLVGPILGPVVGGLLLGGLGWRWIFWINVPFCVAGLVLAWRGLPDTESRPRGKGRLDLLGLALLSPAVASAIYGLSQAGHEGFGRARVIVPLAVAGVLAVAFVLHALRNDDPILDLRLFRVRSFAASSGLLFLSGLTLYGAMLLLPLYYQQLRGASALSAGLLLAPQGVGALLSRTAAGRLTDRVGARPVLLGGLAVAVAGTVPYALAGPHTNEALLAVALVVRGAGMGAVMIPILAAAYQGLTPAQFPHASSATRILQQVGGSFGGAVIALVLERQLVGHSAASAFQHAFWWTLGFTALAAVVALFLPSARDNETRAAPVKAAEPDAPRVRD